MHHNDTNFMLVLDDRVFYRGLLGTRMKTRRLGSLTFYMTLSGPCRIKEGEGAWRSHDLAVVAPYQPHQVASESGRVISVMIEPERLQPGEHDALIGLVDDPDKRAELAARIRGAAMCLADNAMGGDLTPEAFDRLFLGRSLASRSLDRRVSRVIDALKREQPDSAALASDLAAGVGLSSSRFLHLFKDQTGVSFRNYRMWQRARTFLLHANHDTSLTEVALSLGYPDSSHFSHSIRKTFGLKPRSIRVGSQNLRVASSPAMAATLTA